MKLSGVLTGLMMPLEMKITERTLQFGMVHQLGDEKLEKLDNFQAGATTIYEAHVAAGTYDEVAWGVTWQNGGGEDNYMTNAGTDGSYAVGDKKLVKLANNEAGATTVYVRNTNA